MPVDYIYVSAKFPSLNVYLHRSIRLWSSFPIHKICGYLKMNFSLFLLSLGFFFSLSLSLFGRKNNTFRTSSCNWHELFFLSLLSSSSSSLFLLLCSISYSFHSLFPRSSNRNHLSQNDENRGNLCSWIIDQPSKKKKSTVWTLLLRSWHIPHIVFLSFS